MKIKKSICSILSIIMILSLPMSALAAEKKSSTSIDSSTFSLGRSQMSEELREKYDNYLQMNGSSAQMEVGETRVVYKDSESTLSVTLTASKVIDNTRATSKTSYQTYNFTDSNILGQTSTAFQVDLTCSWISDGSNSKITNLHGEYTNNNTSKYQLTWDSSSATDITHTLGLKVTKNAVNTVYLAFSTWCHCVGSSASAPYISFDCY